MTTCSFPLLLFDAPLTMCANWITFSTMQQFVHFINRSAESISLFLVLLLFSFDTLAFFDFFDYKLIERIIWSRTAEYLELQ